MRVLLVLPTTGGPLLLRGLRPRAGLPRSAAFADGDYRPLPWSGDYARLTAPDGPLARLVPAASLVPHELRLSGSFDTGRSWEVPVALAHGLLARGHAVAGSPAEADLALWSTGAVDLDLALIEGDYALLDKVDACRALLDTLSALPLAVVLPPGRDREAAARALAARRGAVPPRVVEAGTVAAALDEVFPPARAAGRRGERRRGGLLAAAAGVAGLTVAVAAGGLAAVGTGSLDPYLPAPHGPVRLAGPVGPDLAAAGSALPAADGPSTLPRPTPDRPAPDPVAPFPGPAGPASDVVTAAPGAAAAVPDPAAGTLTPAPRSTDPAVPGSPSAVPPPDAAPPVPAPASAATPVPAPAVPVPAPASAPRPPDPASPDPSPAGSPAGPATPLPETAAPAPGSGSSSAAPRTPDPVPTGPVRADRPPTTPSPASVSPAPDPVPAAPAGPAAPSSGAAEVSAPEAPASGGTAPGGPAPAAPVPTLTLEELHAPAGASCRTVAFGAVAPEHRPVAPAGEHAFAPTRLAPDLCGLVFRPARGAADAVSVGPALAAVALPPLRRPDGSVTVYLREKLRRKVVYDAQVRAAGARQTFTQELQP